MQCTYYIKKSQRCQLKLSQVHRTDETAADVDERVASTMKALAEDVAAGKVAEVKAELYKHWDILAKKKRIGAGWARGR